MVQGEWVERERIIKLKEIGYKLIKVKYDFVQIWKQAENNKLSMRKI